MNVFLPVESCPSLPPITLFSRVLPQMLRWLTFFYFSNFSTCPGDTCPSPNPFYTHSFRFPLGHPAVRFSFTSHHPSLSNTNLISLLSSYAACYTLDCLCYCSCCLSPFLFSCQSHWLSYSGLFFFSSVWTSSRLALISSTASDCPRPASHDCQVAVH